jgi:hypothetical protein
VQAGYNKDQRFKPGKPAMRIDKNNPNKRYTDFWDWLFADVNYFWIIAMGLGYAYYLVTTYEV